MPRFSIIIPYYNRWDLTHARMSEIYGHLYSDIEVILVNDASPELDCRSGAGFWQKGLNVFPIKYVENPQNLGFGGSNNRGAKAATGDILVFLSNDVVISGNFLPQIEKIIAEKDGKVIVGGRVLYEDTGWNTLMIKGKKSIVCYPEGWLIAVTPAMWESIGGFDPIYSPYDYEDVDLGAWATYNNVPLVGLNSAYLHHLSGQTIYKVNPERQKVTIAHRKLFEDKWTALFETQFA